MAMTLTSSSATIGLQSRLLQTNTNVFGQIQIGVSNQSITFDDSNVIYSLQAFLLSPGSFYYINPLTGLASGGSGITAGQAQVETATAVGTCTTAGNVSVTINRNGQSTSISGEWMGAYYFSGYGAWYVGQIVSLSGSLYRCIQGYDQYNGPEHENPPATSPTFWELLPWNFTGEWVSIGEGGWSAGQVVTNNGGLYWCAEYYDDYPNEVDYPPSSGTRPWVQITPTSSIGGPATNGETISVSVPIALNDTAATWAGKVRTALAETPSVSALFSVSGSSTAIVLTRKPLQIFQGTNINVPYYAANDSALNIAIDAGSTGVTSAATSTNTTAGVETSGSLVLDGDGKDIEGNTIGTLTRIDAALFKVVGGGVTISNGSNFVAVLGTNGQQFLINPSISGSVGIFADAPTSVQVTILGKV